MVLKCIIHLEAHGQCDGDIKTFDDNLWEKIKSADRTRRSLYRHSKYFIIDLPDYYTSEMGYHANCYKAFTAIKSVSNAENRHDSKQSTRRLSVGDDTSSTSGIFPDKCIFCDSKSRKTHGSREFLTTCETLEAQDTILQSAEALNDSHLLLQIQNIDFIAKEVKYHNSCRSAYNLKATRIHCKKDKSQLSTAHTHAYDMLKKHIESTIICLRTAEKLTSLHELYMSYLNCPSSYRAHDLCSKIQKSFPDSIKVHKESNKGGVILYHCSLTHSEALRHVQMDKSSVKEVAKYLRRQIMHMMSTAESLPEHLSASALNAGEGSRPSDLVAFFRVLYTGADDPASDRVERLVNSVTDDVIYASTHAKVKTGKHLTLALGLKSMTGSRKVIDTLNRFGHCVSYHTVEAIETDLATEISQRGCATPDGIQCSPGLSTALAWDNYDEFTESLSGSDSLHDTVGICYQNISEALGDVPVPEENINSPPWKKSRRTLYLKEKNIEPYRKKPRISVFTFAEQVIPRPINITRIEYRDIAWIMSLLLDSETPMWVGWNSQLTDDPLPLQHIEYMENLTLPSTRLDVIAETLRISQQVANECGDEYAIVHYDLLMAKSAIQIQVTESPKFDDVFICFGPFHIELAYFACLGYFLDGSGGLEIMTEAGVLAPGSLNGILLGKHYNRYVFKVS